MRLVRQVSGYHELAPSPDFVLAPGDAAGDHRSVGRPHPTSRQRRAGERVRRARGRLDDRCARRADDRSSADHRCRSANDAAIGARHRRRSPALVPWPARSTGSVGGHVSRDRWAVRSAARLRSGSNEVGDVWRAVARAERRLHPDGPWALGIGDDIGAGAWSVSAVPGAVAPGHYEVDIDDTSDEVVVAASDTAGFRHGFVTIAQLLRDGSPKHVRIVDGPTYEWRGLHVDLARQFFPASDVERLIDLAAWRKLDRLHLHLTDDEAWRVPIEGYPELTDVGAWRGHGLTDPAVARLAGRGHRRELHGRRDPRMGRARPRARRRDRARGRPAGPLSRRAHGGAVAARSRRHDRGAQRAALRRQLAVSGTADHDAVRRGRVRRARGDVRLTVVARRRRRGGAGRVGALAGRGRLRQGPRAGRHERHRGGVHGRRGRRRCDASPVARSGRGRRSPSTAASSPSDGYVVVWKSAADARVLAEAGFDVVVSAPDAYYLDMALDDDWTSPGRELGRHRRARRRLRVRARRRLVGRSPPTSARRAGVRVDRAHPVGGDVRRARLPTPRRDRRAGVVGPRSKAVPDRSASRASALPRLSIT